MLRRIVCLTACLLAVVMSGGVSAMAMTAQDGYDAARAANDAAARRMDAEPTLIRMQQEAGALRIGLWRIVGALTATHGGTPRERRRRAVLAEWLALSADTWGRLADGELTPDRTSAALIQVDNDRWVRWQRAGEWTGEDVRHTAVRQAAGLAACALAALAALLAVRRLARSGTPPDVVPPTA